MKYILFSLVVFFSVEYSYAQLSRKYKEHGDKQMQEGNVQGALKNYFIGMKSDSSSADLVYAYATALRITNNYKKAAYYYKSVRPLDKNRDYAVAGFYAAQMFKYLGDYSNAQKETKRFIKRFRGEKSSYEFVKATYDIEHWDDLIHLKKDTLELELSNNHEVNTPFSEFSAFFESDTTILYSTLRSDSMRKRLVLDSSTYYSRIHRAKNNSDWKGQGKLEAFNGEEKINIANASLDSRKEFAYYTECDKGICKIYRARNENGNWVNFEALPEEINMPKYTSTQPVVARIDGYDILYFVSNRPNGYGNFDIWYSIVYSNGLFEEPRNLGQTINSPGNEISPFFLDEESALYFSSDFYTGLGGFDVFRSVLLDEEYTNPENMAIPINSSYNDLYFRYENFKAVLTSNREGSLTDKYENCCNDLYFFEYEPKIKKADIELSNIEKIQKLLPLRLYFDNDEPNPRSNDTSTSILYGASYIQYISKLSQYEREYSKGLYGEEKESAEEEIALFFDNEVKLGKEDLKTALELISEELLLGKQIELSIRGYASPLSKSDYNRRLTLRRINSVINEIQHFNSGVLTEYIESGDLEIIQIPFGEDRLSTEVSDDINDKRNAIYSKKAAFERRVEIIAVEIK